MSSFRLTGVGRIPLRDRQGNVRAYATVDLADYADVSQHRWCMNGNGYVMRSVGGRYSRHTEFLHRRLLGLAPWKEDRRSVDHINRAPLDNRRENLRIASPAEQSQNIPGKRGRTSRYRGVSWSESRGVWMAQAKCGSKRFTKWCKSEEEARLAVVAWRLEHMPFAVEAAA